MIDMHTEQLLTMAEASKMIPGRPSLCALWRWRTRGVGGRVLESLNIGGRPYTSIEAIERFAVAHGGTPQQSEHRSPAARERAIAKAERELEQAGI